MAAANGTGADPVHEPPHKVAKTAPLLKVKKLSDKAVLPSRGSALAAGYDLSRYVPAPLPGTLTSGLSPMIFLSPSPFLCPISARWRRSCRRGARRWWPPT